LSDTRKEQPFPVKLKIAALGAKGIPYPGGIELVMEEIGSRLVKRGHRFDIFVRESYMEGRPIRSYRGMGLPRSPGIRTKHLDALSHSASGMVKIAFENYNVIYINSFGLSALAWFPRILGKKVVVHTHGLDWKRDKWGAVAKRLIRMTAWSSVHLPHATFCVCLEDKMFLEKRFGAKCHYVPNGMPQAVYREPSKIRKYGLQEGTYLLFMARLVPEKGAHFLLEAWKRLPTTLKKGIQLVIAGDSNHRDRYFHTLLQYKDLENVIFTGFVTGRLKQELLSNALCFIQPSTIEGMPVSILEVMSYGRMVLASDIQENVDVLGGYGWTFKSRDVDDLTRKLLEILHMDKGLITDEGQKLLNYGKVNYDWEKIVDKVENVLLFLATGRCQ